ncbi:MAG: ABC transporter, ATP-binding protein [Candidatus Carbobacillus altaicus]|uniref:ABC transporter, ATP-binding protein n=1 Tax=Candidatus Carbonibacillus altaicus TaxID=2163959 RepID=A0A2R6Y0M0_9BACL|nr:MAG: ABC transporter, ATP-binding protein [Candidatus Carbobacillus altaicus]
MPFADQALKLEGVVKRYPHFTLGPIDAALSLHGGTVTAIVGKNGSGKSLFLNMLIGWIKPTVGRIVLFGQMYPEGEVAIKSRLAYMPDLPELYYGTTGRWLMKQAQALAPDWDAERFREMIRRLELPDLDLPFETLSKGQRERLLLALVLSRTVPLYVFDEPTSGLDPYVQAMLYDVWRERLEGGSAILISSHDMAAVERFADEIVVMNDGRLLGPYVKDDLLDQWAWIMPEAEVPDDELNALPGVVAVKSSSDGETVMTSFGAASQTVSPEAGRAFVSRDREKTEAALKSLGYRVRSSRLTLSEIVRHLLAAEHMGGDVANARFEK